MENYKLLIFKSYHSFDNDNVDIDYCYLTSNLELSCDIIWENWQNHFSKLLENWKTKYKLENGRNPTQMKLIQFQSENYVDLPVWIKTNYPELIRITNISEITN